MFQDPALLFISDKSLYFSWASSVRGFVTVMDLLPTSDMEPFSQPLLLSYEMDFSEVSQTLVLGLN